MRKTKGEGKGQQTRRRRRSINIKTLRKEVAIIKH
jgi:hypothetical protein